MDPVTLLRQSLGQTRAVVGAIAPERYGDPTPCAGWSVRDLINHMTGGATMFAVSAESGSVPDELLGQLLGGDNVGDDPPGALNAAFDRAEQAFAQPGILDKVVTLPFGQMPAGVAAGIGVFDITVHACDLAVASGQPLGVIDDALAATALEMGRQMIGAEMRAPGLFDAEVAIDADRPVQERLLAFAGRRV